ncbi:O-acetyl-ADP-ribose deacetylase (regulator of RNase III), contains Macro domain [Caminicella sporogenes DSM 14501]|uniref:O-acetyl-ADP-ribose deacetylase (Regulator of RNase III), contains Macro domain n=1 Tax=Caminicella sporogenes DSM 14501 TaxID=1121266 RepID=A0A1M6RUE5_9FIRM|nr:O-acetyl-ADP-ribose deacetylase [Caminicella sporogenes]RKD23645.1 O-acetyl-ADP-ribose deacetylase [Caminicella sporogenes]SHK36055.1 O-acetyl-ADP-ribose deacetylase (regulator of RNase III), contains Macro domain [Caminicella sporogenes DSM 14501]
MELTYKGTKIKLILGDITKEDTEAIVNAANSSLLGGGGVDGAIHKAGGPKILEECKEIRKRQGKCPTGEAVITTGGNLKAKYVIHTVGPVWKGGNNNEPKLLANAYKNSLKLAHKYNIKTIAFPSISTGVYGYPKEKACIVALNAVKEMLDKLNFEEIRFILFSKYDFDIYKKTINQIY